MNYKQSFKHWDKLSFFERLILKTCCYLPPNQANSDGQNSLDEKRIEIYKSLYHKAFGEELWNGLLNKVVLDFGCGRGEFVLAAARNGAKLSMGVDIQDNSNDAKQLAEQLGLSNVKLIVGESKQLASKSIDVLTSHDAFEHFEDPDGILREMVRLVKPGGKIFIKFGPTWMSPWGKHMFGTFRKDRPWIHLIFPERSIMRVHSVYHNADVLLEKYFQRPGGLNKMTVARSKRIVSSNVDVVIEKLKVSMIYNLTFFRRIPVLKELFSSGVTIVLKVKG